MIPSPSFYFNFTMSHFWSVDHVKCVTRPYQNLVPSLKPRSHESRYLNTHHTALLFYVKLSAKAIVIFTSLLLSQQTCCQAIFSSSWPNACYMHFFKDRLNWYHSLHPNYFYFYIYITTYDIAMESYGTEYWNFCDLQTCNTLFILRLLGMHCLHFPVICDTLISLNI